MHLNRVTQDYKVNITDYKANINLVIRYASMVLWLPMRLFVVSYNHEVDVNYDNE